MSDEPTRYRVSGQRVTVNTQVDPDKPGRADVDIFHGQDLPDDVPDEQIQRLLDAGEIVPADAVDGGDAGGGEESSSPPAGAAKERAGKK